jgi:hypothetical protein
MDNPATGQGGAWTRDELDRIAAVDEVRIATLRRDATLRKPVIVWVVRHGDDLYIRSVRGRTGAWYRGVQTRHVGHISAGGVEKDITFIEGDDAINDALDAAYRNKYRRYAANIVGSTVTPQARDATLRLVPRTSRA